MLQVTPDQVLHDLNQAYKLLPESAYYTEIKDFRRKVSRVYFRISKAETGTIRSGIVLFMRQYRRPPTKNMQRQTDRWIKECGALDVVYALNRYLFEVPKDYQPSSPLTIVGRDMALYPWTKNKAGSMVYSGDPFRWWMLWPDEQREFDKLALKFKRRSEIDPGR